MVLESTDYSIAWIAPLPTARAAATALLDERHEVPPDFDQTNQDSNSYTWGRIGIHNIVIASLPAGLSGSTPAATTALNLISSLPQIRIGLLVGTASGIPLELDIRLGDVVVSQPTINSGGVIQHQLSAENQPNQSLNKPPQVLLHALSALQAEHDISESKVPDFLDAMWAANPIMKTPRKKEPGYVHQGVEKDRLFLSWYTHIEASDGGYSTCDNCEESGEIKRDMRDFTDPEIHYGSIASVTAQIQDAVMRDAIAKSVPGSICIETEAAGLMDYFPCLVIRGISDYADTHHGKYPWQRYASATAAAYAKELIQYIPMKQLAKTARVVDILASISTDLKGLQATTENIETGIENLRVDILDKHQKDILNRLPIAKGASFNSQAQEHNATCLPDTRVELLKEIQDWAHDQTSKSIFWLNGMAGTGKSTISKTIAQILSDQDLLGASFFFKRGQHDEENMSKFFTTMAADIAIRHPSTAPFIQESIDLNPSIISAAVELQFDQLFLKPLSKMEISKPIVLIIDALDECDGEGDIRWAIQSFSHIGSICGSGNVKIFCTSRPELPLRLGFKTIHGQYQDIILHDIPSPIIEHDISVFLKYQLAKTRFDYNLSIAQIDHHLQVDWPSQTDIEKLTQLAIPLFIFAATVCRFVADRRLGIPSELLQDVLNFQNQHQSQILEFDQLDATYMPVLNKIIEGLSLNRRDIVIQQFKDVLGPILVSSIPLSASTLAKLVNIPVAVITNRLDMLHSVLQVPESTTSPIRLLHLSFRDLLVDENKQTQEYPFSMNNKSLHSDMAFKCLDLMEVRLQQDICDLKIPTFRRKDINPQIIEAKIPPELRYAAIYWTVHIEKAGLSLKNDFRIWMFLKKHFLHWVEIMILLGHSFEVVGILKTLKSLVNKTSTGILDFLRDAMGVLRSSIPGIDQTPLQLYYSLIGFLPTNNKIHNIFGHLPHGIQIITTMEPDWNQSIQAFNGNWLSARYLTFSPNSEYLAAVCDRCTRIWRLSTGQLLRIVEFDAEGLVFSNNCKFLVVSRRPCTTMILRIDNGEVLWNMSDSHNPVECTTFSSDDSQVIIAYADGSIRCLRIDGDGWEVISEFTEERPLSLYSHIVLSFDGSLLAFRHDQSTEIDIKRTCNGTRLYILDESSDIMYMKFSRDAKHLFITLRSADVQIYCMETGILIHSFPALRFQNYIGSITPTPSYNSNKLLGISHPNGMDEIYDMDSDTVVKTLQCPFDNYQGGEFSPNLQYIAWGSYKEIQIHNTGLSELPQPTKRTESPGHAQTVHLLSISPNSTFAASGSTDKTICIWDIKTGQCIQTLSGDRHNSTIETIDFSTDSKLLISSCRDGFVRVWEIHTGNCLCTYEIGSSAARSIRLPHSKAQDQTSTMISYNNTQIQLWKAETGSCIGIFAMDGVVSWNSKIALSYDSEIAAVETKKGLLICSLGKSTTITNSHRLCYIQFIKALSFAPDSDILAISTALDASTRSTIQLWRATTSQYIQSLDFGFLVRTLQFDPINPTTRLFTDCGAMETYPECYSRPAIPHFPHIVSRSQSPSCPSHYSIDTGPSNPPVFIKNPESQPPATILGQFKGYGISEDGCWITWQGNDLLWLPAELRQCRYYISGDLIVIGAGSGRVTILKLSSKPIGVEDLAPRSVLPIGFAGERGTNM